MRLRKSHLFACLSTAAAVIAVPTTVLVSAAFAADPPPPPAVAKVSLAAPASVTQNATTGVAAHLTLGSIPLAHRTVQFVERPVGSSTWTPFASEPTDSNGWAGAVTPRLTAPVELGAFYVDSIGVVQSNVASSVVHVVDIAPSAPKLALANATVVVTSHLVKDRAQGLAGQPVKVWLRAVPSLRWSFAGTVRTDSRGIAALARRFTRTTQVGVKFLGARNLAASPLAITTIVVKPRPASRSMTRTGFVFPFAIPSQAQSIGGWTQDQGVDIAADGYACGASAILVAVGDGVVIQEGISGFGSTAPVIRMTSGPLAGRNVYYGHTGHVYVTVGAHVRAGQRIAQIGCGSVGNSEAPHVEIGVGYPGGPPCCPGFHQTSGLMYRLLVAALRG